MDPFQTILGLLSPLRQLQQRPQTSATVPTQDPRSRALASQPLWFQRRQAAQAGLQPPVRTGAGQRPMMSTDGRPIQRRRKRLAF